MLLYFYQQQEPDNDELNYDVHFWIGSDSSQVFITLLIHKCHGQL